MINQMNRSSPMRMMGLSSGMDTDFMIQQMMRVHQMRIDNKMRSRTILQWRQQEHNSLADQIKSFRSSFMTALGSNGLLNRTMYNSVSTTISANNAGRVSVSAPSGSALGTIRINSITSLAKGASVVSSAIVTKPGGGSVALTDRLTGFDLDKYDYLTTDGKSMEQEKRNLEAAGFKTE